jgi:tetratricopeptide (TPR) repeat protein
MNMSNQTLAHARALDQQGRLAEAIVAYRQFLTIEPRNGDALQLLGIALARIGNTGEAVEALTAAATLQPGNPFLQANLANALNEAGRPSEALACYGRAVVLKPDFAVAHRGRGMTLLRLGQLDAAVQALGNAIRLQPDNAAYENDLGVALERLDRKADALTHFERAVQLNPGNVEAHHNRALVEAALGRHAQALISLDRALALQPQRAAIHANRGHVLADLDRADEAIASYNKALALQPRDAMTLRRRGQLLLTQQRISEAIADFQASAALAPQDIDTHFLQGVALALQEKHETALLSFERALQLDPRSAEILNNRGVALGQLARHEEALASFLGAIANAPGNIAAHTNVANTLTTLQRHSEAQEYFDLALSIKPQDSSLLWGKARALLSLGDFRQGWPLYEARLQLEHLRSLRRHTDMPRWQGGESIEGKTLFVYAEQGLGDTVQFCRYLPLLEARGAKVIFEVQPALKTLLQRSLPTTAPTHSQAPTPAQILAVDEPLPPFDLATPLLSLPWLLGTELDTIPADVPYLAADPTQKASWQGRLANLPGLKVGMAWQGNIETEKHGGYIGRSSGLAAAAPLAEVPGVTLVSLQKGEPSQQRAQVSFAAKILELTDPLVMGSAEMMDTVALMSALDLIVTTDTLTAHLAGALGIPVWVVLSAAPDWRWLTERQDSPWYPTMRLFRQRAGGGWSEVYERVARELDVLSTARQGSF